MVLSDATCSIAEFSRCFGASFRTLHFYEEIGLLRPVRVGTMRCYSEDDYHRMTFVKEGKSMGLSLDQIMALLKGRDTSKPLREWRLPSALIDDCIGILEQRRSKLERKLAKLKAMREPLDPCVGSAVIIGAGAAHE